MDGDLLIDGGVLNNLPCDVMRATQMVRTLIAVDLSPFDIANQNEVFYASDRPYGLIEGTVTRDDVRRGD